MVPHILTECRAQDRARLGAVGVGRSVEETMVGSVYHPSDRKERWLTVRGRLSCR